MNQNLPITSQYKCSITQDRHKSGQVKWEEKAG